jgi:hypothetical protein
VAKVVHTRLQTYQTLGELLLTRSIEGQGIQPTPPGPELQNLGQRREEALVLGGGAERHARETRAAERRTGTY